MRVGIISNSELSSGLIHFLKSAHHDVRLYLGKFSEQNLQINYLLSACQQTGVPVFREKEKDDLYRWINEFDADKFFVCYYNRLIDIKKLGNRVNTFFNIHPGKLPEYRGPSPVFWQLKNGEQNPGVCIHFLSGSFDSGDIIWQKQLPDMPYLTMGSANLLLSSLALEGVKEIMQRTEEDILAGAVSQTGGVGYYPRQVFKDVVIFWSRMDAQEIADLVKACSPWNFGAWTYYNRQPLTFMDVEVCNEITSSTPGTITAMETTMQIACANHTLLQVNFLRLNEEYINSRHAVYFGFTKGGQFADPPENVQ